MKRMPLILRGIAIALLLTTLGVNAMAGEESDQRFHVVIVEMFMIDRIKQGVLVDLEQITYFEDELRPIVEQMLQRLSRVLGAFVEERAEVTNLRDDILGPG